jgi:hypothetical protein
MRGVFEFMVPGTYANHAGKKEKNDGTQRSAIGDCGVS